MIWVPVTKAANFAAAFLLLLLFLGSIPLLICCARTSSPIRIKSMRWTPLMPFVTMVLCSKKHKANNEAKQ